MSDRQAREERFGELVRENRARLRRIACAYGADPHDAEDLHQEFLLETVAAVLVAALFGWEAATASSVLVRVGAAVVVGAAALIPS